MVLRIGTRVIGGFGVILSLSALVAIGGVFALSSVNQRAGDAEQGQYFVGAISEARVAKDRYSASPSDDSAAAVRTALDYAMAAAETLGQPEAIEATGAAQAAFDRLADQDVALASIEADLASVSLALRDQARGVVEARVQELDRIAEESAAAVAEVGALERAQYELAVLRENILKVRLDTVKPASSYDTLGLRDIVLQTRTLPSVRVRLERSAPTLVAAEQKALEELSAQLTALVGAFDEWTEASEPQLRAVSGKLNRAARTSAREASGLIRSGGRMMVQARNRFRRLVEQEAVARGAAVLFTRIEARSAQLDAAANAFIAQSTPERFEAAQALHGALVAELAAAAESGDAEGLAALNEAADRYGAQLLQLRDVQLGRDQAVSEAASSADEAGEAALAYASAQMSVMNSESQLALSVIGAVGGASVLIGLIAAVLVGRSIARPVKRITEDAKAIAQGALDRVIRDEHRRDEIGDIAAAVAHFRENAHQVEALQRQRASDEAEAAAARKAMMADLQTAFGGVVEAAVEGDFSQRVDTRFDDAELAALSDGLNRLVETVETGVGETRRVISRMAAGALNERMSGAFSGAFSDLQENVNAMSVTLAEMIDAISATSSAIDASSADISNSAADLASRASSQAVSLEETVATMEQISTTIKTNADHADAARGLADEASEKADHGAAIVEQTVTAMSQIEKSAEEIGSIVSVIDNIAFQTNLLALNAAVEAARAGDAGKGFAVVASEVRTLAQRAAESARDIRTLIDDSSNRVAGGVSLVQETGERLALIVESIGTVSTSIRDISSACREQSIGVNEVSSKLAEMDALTQQNSVAAEQGSEKAQTLTADADRLRDQIAFFDKGEAAEPLDDAA